MYENSRVTGILLAGGSGSRFGGEVNKVYMTLGDKPVLSHSLQVMRECEIIDDIVVVCRDVEEETVREIVRSSQLADRPDRALEDGNCKDAAFSKEAYSSKNACNGKKCRIVHGGSTRQRSVYNALQTDCGQIVVIHDGARPFLTDKFIRRCVEALDLEESAESVKVLDADASTVNAKVLDADVSTDSTQLLDVEKPLAYTRMSDVKESTDGNELSCKSESCPTVGSAVAVPAKDTIKLVDADGFVTQTVPREHAWQVQTPQCFVTSALRKAHEAFRDVPGITDDCMLIERAHGRIRLVQGDYRNIKITTPEDMLLAERFLADIS